MYVYTIFQNISSFLSSFWSESILLYIISGKKYILLEVLRLMHEYKFHSYIALPWISLIPSDGQNLKIAQNPS